MASHWNEDGMTRRLGTHRGAKEKGEGIFCTDRLGFFRAQHRGNG